MASLPSALFSRLRETNALLQPPDFETHRRAWFRQHRAAHADPGLKDAAASVDFATVESRVLADYSVAVIEQRKADQATRLRQTHAIRIDGKVLATL